MMIVYILGLLVVIAAAAVSGYYYAMSGADIELLEKDMVINSMREYVNNLESVNKSLKAELTALKIEESSSKPTQKLKKTPTKKVAKKSYKKSA